jgi:hypothetical protein
MLQADDGQDGGAKKRMQLDRSLLAALADRWHPETHMFHLPCGEMAPHVAGRVVPTRASHCG